MANFPNSFSLKDLQAYQKAICKERGWDQATPTETYLLFVEEIGELAKAVRYQLKLFTESGKELPKEALESEFSDVFGYLLELANAFDIDLAEAYKKKEEINAKRSWGEKGE